MKRTLRKLGNSKGVLIPAAIPASCGIFSEVELHVESNRIIIEPCRASREGWAEASACLARVHEDALIWPDFGNSDDENWEWQP
jgi:antitoxin MazE